MSLLDLIAAVTEERKIYFGSKNFEALMLQNFNIEVILKMWYMVQPSDTVPTDKVHCKSKWTFYIKTSLVQSKFITSRVILNSTTVWSAIHVIADIYQYLQNRDGNSCFEQTLFQQLILIVVMQLKCLLPWNMYVLCTPTWTGNEKSFHHLASPEGCLYLDTCTFSHV